MSNISEIDVNFNVKSEIKRDGLIFLDARSAPFEINGVLFEDGKFRRMPDSIAKSVSDGVHSMHANTAGGRVRFITDSPFIAINAKMPVINKMPHFTLCGSAGFDLYADNKYIASFMPPFWIADGYESIVELGEAKTREITINFPLYSDVSELYVGLSDRSQLNPPKPYSIERPIVYYGSSITQGGCASRPGNSYQSIISRALDADFINLGFSGNARGEREISDYIASLSMSAFVYDYDHNAPTPEHLEATHERMFREIRRAHPTLPIVIMSRPKYHLNADEEARLDIIRRTYECAVASGDKNVYFIDGRALMKIAEDNGTVDGSHPNDLGFFSMANEILGLLKRII